jgi:hypothetical protein
MCLRVDSQGRCVRQATICRESGAVDHQQVEAGAHVESFSMPYRDSFRTAAKRGYAPMRFDPWTRRCSASKGRGRRRMFQQPWRHLRMPILNLPPACGLRELQALPLRRPAPVAFDPLHRSLVSISPFISLSAAAAEGTVSRESTTGAKMFMNQGEEKKSRYHGNSRRETSLLETRQSG